jgi:hypothetical protein
MRLLGLEHDSFEEAVVADWKVLADFTTTIAVDTSSC